MAELPGRETWLQAVARTLDAMPDAEAEVLEELSAHLDDRVADAVARGVDPVEAERRARNRLGDPATLGRSLRKARRGRRSALALVGGSAVALGTGTAIGTVVGFVGLYLAWTAVFMVDTLVAKGNGASPPGVYAALVSVAIGLSLAAWTVPAAIANRATWPFGTVRRVVAAVILLPGLLIASLLPDQDLDGWLAILYPAIPVVAAGLALTAPRSGTRSAWKPAVAILIGSTAMMYVAWPYPVDTPLDIPPADIATVGLVAAFNEDLLPPYGVGAGLTVDEQGRRVQWVSFDDINGWHDFAVVLWPLDRINGRWQFGARPILTVPYVKRGSQIVASYDDPRPRDPLWFVRFRIATGPNGVRMIFPDAFNAQRTEPWRGAVLDWWLGR